MPPPRLVGENPETAAAVRVQRTIRGYFGRQTAVLALWDKVEAEEKQREARQLAQLEQGFELLAHVADERKKFEQQIIDRSDHFHRQKSTKAEAAISVQRHFRRHKKYVQMCTWANPRSKIQAESVARERQALSLTSKLRYLLESNSGPLSGGGGHREFEKVCKKASMSTRNKLDWNAMFSVFQQAGLDAIVGESDMRLLHDYVGGHYPTLLEFLKQGNIDRAETELRLFMYAATEKQETTADLDDVFAFFDSDGNGSISKAEFKEALCQLNFDTQLRDRELDTLMNRFAHHGDDGSIDYSDFLDSFGSSKDYFKAQATMADIVIYLQQLVAVSDHKGKHSVSLSHSMSVHSPLHLNSMLDAHRPTSPKFGQRGFGRRSVHMKADEIYETNQPADNDNWWVDSTATSIAGDAPFVNEDAATQQIFAAPNERDIYSNSYHQQQFENNKVALVQQSIDTPAAIHPEVHTPEDQPLTPSTPSHMSHVSHVSRSSRSSTVSPSSLSPSAAEELQSALEKLEAKLTTKMERAMRYNEAAEEAAKEVARAAAKQIAEEVARSTAIKASREESISNRKMMREEAVKVAKRAAEEVVQASNSSFSSKNTNSHHDQNHQNHQNRQNLVSPADVKRAVERSKEEVVAELRSEFKLEIKGTKPLDRTTSFILKTADDLDPNVDRSSYNNDIIRAGNKQLKEVKHTLIALEQRTSQTAAHEKRLGDSFVELQRQITHLEIEHRELERTQMKQRLQSEELLLGHHTTTQSQKVVTREEHVSLIEKAKSVEQVNDRLRKDMERLQNQVRKLEQEKMLSASPSVVMKTPNKEQQRYDHHSQTSNSAVAMKELAKLAYEVVETGGTKKEILKHKVATILGANSFEQLNKSLEGKRSPFKDTAAPKSASAPTLSPISHDNHIAFLVSAQNTVGLGSSSSNSIVSMRTKTKAKKKSKRVKRRRKIIDIEELRPGHETAWGSSSDTERKAASATGGGGLSPKYEVRERITMSTPQPRRVTTKIQQKRTRPLSAPRRRQNRQNVGYSYTRSGSHGVSNGISATRAQVQQLKQRLMRMIVANRLFSVNELNFVFENAIELSPFNRQDMTNMINELKAELGLSSNGDKHYILKSEVQNGEEEKRTKGSESMRSRKGVERRQHRPPGGKHYHHDLA